MIAGRRLRRPGRSGSGSGGRPRRSPACGTPTSCRSTTSATWPAGPTSPWSSSRGAAWPRGWPARRSRPAQAAALLATLAEAVQAAHGAGSSTATSSRPTSCSTADGTPKVTDFGLARRLEGGAGLTQSGTALGTPSYMAPEQARGQSRAIGPAADVYALGAILYETADGPAAVPGRDAGGDGAAGDRPGAGPAVAAERQGAARPGDDLPEVPAEGAAPALSDGAGRWPTTCGAWRRAGRSRRGGWGRPSGRGCGAAGKPAIAALAAAVALAVVGGTAATIAVQAAANRRLDHKNAELSEALGRVARANAELKDANSRVERGTAWPSRRSRPSTPASARTSCSSKTSSRSCRTGC